MTLSCLNNKMSKWTKKDISFMRRALELAASQRGKTSPDPMVGAVLVKKGKILSEGYHSLVRTPHAEAWAIGKAKKHSRGAALYVNLEPCCYFKAKANPPCTQAIISAGLKKVYIAMVDPNPMVAGKGIEELKAAGVEVEIGLLEEEAKKLNEVFIKYITTGRPFVTLKSAMSLDGKIATSAHESFWITGIESRRYAHSLRAGNDAVMVGIGTVKKDDPSFTVRHVEGDNPKKVVVDSKLEISTKSKVVANEPKKTIVCASKGVSAAKIKNLGKKGVRVLSFPAKSGKLDLDLVMEELGKMKISSILIEGGGRLNASALKCGVVDKVDIFIAPKIIGGEHSPTPVEGLGIKKLSEALKLKDISIKHLGEDILVEGYLAR